MQEQEYLLKSEITRANRLQEEINRRESKYKMMEKAHKFTLGSKEQIIEKMESDIKKQKRELAKLEHGREPKETLKAMSQQIIDQSNLVEAMKRENVRLKQEARSDQESFEAYRLLQVKLREELNEKDTLVSELTQKNREMASQYRQEVEDKLQQIQDLRSRGASKDVTGLQTQFTKELQETKKHYDDQIADLQAEIESLQSRRKFDEETSKLEGETKIKEKEAEISDLRSELESSRMHIQSLTTGRRTGTQRLQLSPEAAEQKTPPRQHSGSSAQARVASARRRSGRR
jgi:chromosome segregation ATPase